MNKYLKKREFDGEKVTQRLYGTFGKTFSGFKEISQYNRRSLMWLPNVGEATMKELEDILQKRQLSLGDESYYGPVHG